MCPPRPFSTNHIFWVDDSSYAKGNYEKLMTMPIIIMMSRDDNEDDHDDAMNDDYDDNDNDDDNNNNGYDGNDDILDHVII